MSLHDRLWEWIPLVLLVLVLSTAAALLTAVVVADGRPVGCYVEAGWQGRSLLRQSVPWREDRSVGLFDSFAEAAGAAEQLGCKLTE